MQPKQLAEQQIQTLTREFYDLEENPILEPTKLRKNFVKFICYVFKRGISAFIVVFGRRGSGKTDFALLLSEILFYHGNIKNFATNINIFNSHGIPFTNITNLEDLRFWAKHNRGRKVFIFDEIGKALRRRSPMSSLNIQLIDDFQILRKYKLSIVACTPSDKYIDNAVLGDEVLDGIFIKPWIFKSKKRNQKIALYHDYMERWYKELKNIRGTNITFDTYGTAPFKEHSPQKVPHLKTLEEQRLWLWCNGANSNEIGVSRMYIHRITRRFIKEALERRRNE